MAGILESLGQGLSSAGGILSPQVYQDQQVTQRLLLSQQQQNQILQKQQEQAQKQQMLGELNTAVQNGAISPQDYQTAMQRLGVQPMQMGPTPQTQGAQQANQLNQEFLKRLQTGQPQAPTPPSIPPAVQQPSIRPASEGGDMMGSPDLQSLISRMPAADQGPARAQLASQPPAGMQQSALTAPQPQQGNPLAGIDPMLMAGSPLAQKYQAALTQQKRTELEGINLDLQRRRLEEGNTPIAKANADLKAGRITQPQYEALVSKETSEQSSFMKEASAAFGKDTPEYKEAIRAYLTSKSAPKASTANATNISGVIPQAYADLHGDDYLKTLSPAEASVVKSIAEGKTRLTSASSLRGGDRKTTLAMVAQYDPTFDEGIAPARFATRKDFTSGLAARNVTGINTAIGHLGTMNELGDALGNKSIPAINQVANRIGLELGKEERNNFDIAKGAVADELMRVFRQAGASQQEADHWRSMFMSSGSPTLIKGAIRTAVELLGSRIESLDDQWKRGMVTDQGYPNLLSDKSKSVFKKIGGKLESYGLSDKPSSTPAIPTTSLLGPKKISSDADYNALPSGTEFIDPEGTKRRKP